MTRRLTRRRASWAGPAVAALVVIGWVALSRTSEAPPRADPENDSQVALGAALYAEHCASCHGAQLEGQPDWQSPLPGGGYPAPPHDASGHTWHHDDLLLLDYTKNGGEAFGGPTFRSNMPGFGDRLSDEEIWAVIAFLKAQWPEDIRSAQAERNRSR